MHRILAGSDAAGDDLAYIERRTAADADHHIRPLPSFDRRMQMRKLWLAGKIGIDLRVHACFRKLGADPGGKAGLRQEGIDDKQNGADAIEGFDRSGKAGERTLTETNVWDGGNGEGHAETPWKSG